MSAELRRTIRSETDASRTVLEATLYSREAGFGEAPSRIIATAVSELTRNILKYAGTGELCLRKVKDFGRRGVEIEASDEGPGIRDCDAAMQDHYSSGGTLGLGDGERSLLRIAGRAAHGEDGQQDGAGQDPLDRLHLGTSSRSDSPRRTRTRWRRSRMHQLPWS